MDGSPLSSFFSLWIHSSQHWDVVQILLTYISLKLTDIQMNIDYPDMENDDYDPDYDEDEDHDDLLDEKIKVIKQMK